VDALRLPDPADLEPSDAKAHTALRRYRLCRVTAAAGSDFEEGYGALWHEFGPRGELERRAVVQRWLAVQGGVLAGGLCWQYGLLVARDHNGALAGVRDCHVTVDVDRRECVVYLAHILVLPEFRRGGLATLLRAAPLSLARRALAAAGLDARQADVLLAAEMEPADPSAADTLVRLIVHGRVGFRAVAPAVLPYCQPDFRDLEALGAPAHPLPLLAVVRWVGHMTEALPARLCSAGA
jgi:GNAT superfamily N-acetyltransferase